MKRRILNHRLQPRKKVLGKRGFFFLLLVAAGALLFFLESISLMACLLWMAGILPFFIGLAGMNEDVPRDTVPRPAVVDSVPVGKKGLPKSTALSPSVNDICPGSDPTR
jgi:hypothetical protein